MKLITNGSLIVSLVLSMMTFATFDKLPSETSMLRNETSISINEVLPLINNEEDLNFIISLCQGENVKLSVVAEKSTVSFDGGNADALSLQGVREMPENAVLIVEKDVCTTRDGIETNVEKETTFVALAGSSESYSGSFSASGQKYGVAAACVVRHTLILNNYIWGPTYIKFNSISAQYTYLPSQETEVTRLECSVRLEEMIGVNPYFYSFYENNPRNGVNYSRTLNSGEIRLAGETPRVMMTIYYANGGSDTYEGTLNAKH